MRGGIDVEVMRTDLTALQATTPAANIAPLGGGNQIVIPDWISKINEIVKGINDLLAGYRELTGKPPIGVKNPVTQQHIIQDMPAPNSQPTAQWNHPSAGGSGGVSPTQPNEFQDILARLVQTCRTAESMGYGEKTLGEALNSLPITIRQAGEFLTKLYQQKYGG